MNSAVYAGQARAPANSATGQVSKIVQVVVEVDKATGQILTADVNVVSEVSRRYLVGLLVGRNLMAEVGVIIKDIERDYHTATQRAVIQALHELYQQYMADYLKMTGIQFEHLDA